MSSAPVRIDDSFADERRRLEAQAAVQRQELLRNLAELQRAVRVAGVVRLAARRARPLLPYAAATAGVALTVMLLRRRIPAPLLAIGVAVDVLRIWALRAPAASVRRVTPAARPRPVLPAAAR